MKRIIIGFIVLLLVVGCNSDKKIDKAQMNLYETHWKSLLNESKFQSTSRNFNIEVNFVEEAEGYAYYLTVDNPRVAMYDVEIMVIENKESFNKLEEMQPSAGIFENKFNLIPNQTRKEKNYRKGAILSRSGIEENELSLRVLVTWKNYTKLDTFKEVFEFELAYIEPEVVEPESTETE